MKASELSTSDIGKVIYFSDGINHSNPDYEFKATLLTLGISGSISIDFELPFKGEFTYKVDRDIRVDLGIVNVFARVKDVCNSFSKEWKFFKSDSWESLPIDSEIGLEND